jgi:lipopolysaccharide export system permease protein
MREVAQTFLAVSLLLVLMFFSATFIKQLTETLEGDYPVSILFSLFALKGVGNIVFILPFAFFIAVLLAFGKLYKDNEIVVLLACGAGPRRLFASVGFLAVIVAVMIGYLALFFAPWAEDKSSQLLDEAGARQEIEGIIPGRFNSLGANSPIIYVESLDKDKKRLNGIFVQGSDNGVQYVMSAKRAHEFVDKKTGARYLVLLDGRRYEGSLGERDYRIIEFAEHGIRIRNREVVSSSRQRYAVATTTLWGSSDRGDIAELHWRLALPISTILLALLAVPLSKGSPRGGRYSGLFFGIVLYVIYNNLLTVGRSALGKGEVPLALGLWWVHLLALGLLALIVWQQQRVRGPRVTGGKGA